jgi:cytoskeletal protein CcmA (bactofilin family)
MTDFKLSEQGHELRKEAHVQARVIDTNGIVKKLEQCGFSRTQIEGITESDLRDLRLYIYLGGSDLKIIGNDLKIASKGVLQIDGEIVGDVQGAEVIVGEHGKVTGMVVGEQVVVRGEVSGVIRAKKVALQASSKVEGDIHHMSLAMEEGALFEGRSRCAATESDLNSVVDGKTSDQQKSTESEIQASIGTEPLIRIGAEELTTL